MPFSKVLERFAGVDPKEMYRNIKRAKQKKSPGGKKTPPDADVDPANVVSLRSRRERKRNYGR